MKTVNLEQGSPEWLAWRMNRRMASEAAAACGKSDYTTPLQLAKQKRGIEKVFVNSAMSRGTKFEPDARKWFEASMGVIGSPAVLEMGEYGASLDFICTEVMAEFKVPQSADSLLWKGAARGEIPMMYQYQMTQQMAIAGRGSMFFCVYLPEEEIGHIQKFEFDQNMWDSIQRGWDEFWNTYMVGDLVTERNDADWLDACERYRAAKSLLDTVTKRLDTCKQELIELAPTGAKGCGLQLIKSNREGSISWAKACKELNLDMAQFEPYRGKSTEVFTVKETKE